MENYCTMSICLLNIFECFVFDEIFDNGSSIIWQFDLVFLCYNYIIAIYKIHWLHKKKIRKFEDLLEGFRNLFFF